MSLYTPLIAGLVLVGIPAFATDAGMPGEQTPHFGLMVNERGILCKDGMLYRGFGVNYFDAFIRVLLDPEDTSYEAGFQVLAEYGIPFARVMFTGFWPRDMQLYLEDREVYFQRMDGVVRAAEKHGIGLIPSLFWYSGMVPDLVGEPRNQWRNPDSKTHAFMRQYVREVVTRYRNSPAIWGWEFGNEYNLAADLPNAAEHRPKIVPHLGTATQRSEQDDLTHEMIRMAVRTFAQEVHRYDPYRILPSGHSIPRPSAWHQWEEGTWTRDTPEQMFEILAGQHPDPINMISVHIYDEALERLDMLITMVEKLGKPLFVGEFGIAGFGAETERAFGELLERLVQASVPLAALWVYDYRRQDALNVTGTNSRAYQLKALAEVNRRLVSP